MSDALSQLNALLAAAAAAQQQQQLILQLQQQQQQQQQPQNPMFQQFQTQLTQQPSPPSGFPPMLTEQALQSILFAQSFQQHQQQQHQQYQNQQKQQQDQHQNQNKPPQQQSILNSINSDSNQASNKASIGMSLDSLPLPLMSQLPSADMEQLRQEFFNNQKQQHINQQKNYFMGKDSPNLNMNSPSSTDHHATNIHDDQIDILNEFQKISLNDSKASHQNNSSTNNISINNSNNNNNSTSTSQINNNNNNNNTSSNCDNSILSMNDTEIYSADQNYMPGTASLIEDVDKLLMVVLRDGKTLIGYLRSIDQYANLLLSSTIERIHVGNKYGDIPRGIYIVRGENVVLIGEVDFKIQPKVEMIKVDVNEILELQRVEQKKMETEKSKKKSLTEHCLMPQTDAVLDEYY